METLETSRESARVPPRDGTTVIDVLSPRFQSIVKAMRRICAYNPERVDCCSRTRLSLSGLASSVPQHCLLYHATFTVARIGQNNNRSQDVADKRLYNTH
jgi:hypothetical protein